MSQKYRKLCDISKVQSPFFWILLDYFDIQRIIALNINQSLFRFFQDLPKKTHFWLAKFLDLLLMLEKNVVALSTILKGKEQYNVG